MPVNDHGRRLISDADDAKPSVLSDLSEIDYYVESRRGKKERVKTPEDLVGDKEKEFDRYDIRNTYEGVILELTSEEDEYDVYSVMRQDQRTGTAKSYEKRFKYKVGQTVIISRPQEKEDENDWYIDTAPRIEPYHIHAIRATHSFNADFWTFLNRFEDFSSSTQEEFDDLISLQSDKVKVKKGGLFDLTILGVADNLSQPTEKNYIVFINGIAAATKTGNTIFLGVTQGFEQTIDKVAKTATASGNQIEVCNMAPESMGAGYYQTKPIGGLNIIDVQLCADF